MLRSLKRRLFPYKIFFILLTIWIVFLTFSSFKRRYYARKVHSSKQRDEEENWIGLRLSQDQSDYIDPRGVHVVVGRYLGDKTALGSNNNLTEEMLNSNMFDPIPNEGKNGKAVLVSPHLSQKVQLLFQINRFNLMASDRIPLNRSLPDVRRKSCNKEEYNGEHSVAVIIVFHNEAWSTLLRTVTSVINRSPGNLLKEIILVDDASTREFLKKPLYDYVSKFTVNTYVIRSDYRIGLIRARLIGAKNASSEILVFLDAHCECTTGWLSSLILPVIENTNRVTCPVIDIINDETFAYVRSFEQHWGAFNWDLHFRWYAHNDRSNKDLSKPFNTPVMAGGLFAINRKYFFEIGSYDDQMEIWGGENLELSFRIWQCGGSIEIVPCSHVGHLFRKSSPYMFPGGVSQILSANLARVALVWMDEWKDFYFKFHREAREIKNEQKVSERVALRKRLKCRSFKWYLQNIWPQNFMPDDDRFFGKIIHQATNSCLEKPVGKERRNQPTGLAVVSKCWEAPDLLQMFVILNEKEDYNWAGSVATDESICLDVSVDNVKAKLVACSGTKRQKWKYDPVSQILKHVTTGLCMDVISDDGIAFLNNCSSSETQKWIFQPESWK